MTAKPSIVRFADLYDVPAPPGDGYVWAREGGAYVWKAESSILPPDGSVTSAKIAGRAVTSDKISIDWFVQGPTGTFLVSPGSMTTGAALTLGTIYLCPYWLEAGCPFTGIVADVTVAGNAGDVARLGLYADDGTGKPGVRLFDAGNISLAGTGNMQINVAYTAPADMLAWGAVVATTMTGAPQLQRCTGPSGGPLALLTTGMATNTASGWTLSGQSGLPADLTGQGFSLSVNVQRIALVCA